MPPAGIFLQSLQVKSDVDNMFIVTCELIVIIVFSCVILRVIFGPFPYLAVVALVEILKLCLSFNVGMLNISNLLQFLMIYNISIIHQYSEENIKIIAICVGLLAGVPGMINSFMVSHWHVQRRCRQ